MMDFITHGSQHCMIEVNKDSGMMRVCKDFGIMGVDKDSEHDT